VYHDEKGERDVISGSTAESLDRQINTIIAESQARAARILDRHRDLLESIRDELLNVKTIEPDRVNVIMAEVREKFASELITPVPVGRLTDHTPLDPPTNPMPKPGDSTHG
jgi:cell division protease FtsH